MKRFLLVGITAVMAVALTASAEDDDAAKARKKAHQQSGREAHDRAAKPPVNTAPRVAPVQPRVTTAPSVSRAAVKPQRAPRADGQVQLQNARPDRVERLDDQRNPRGRGQLDGRTGVVATPQAAQPRTDRAENNDRRGWNGGRNGWNGRDGSNGNRWSGRSYHDVLRSYNRSHHDRSWYRQRYNSFVLFGGGYYYRDAGYWYPAYGYDPYYSNYTYEQPIYAYDGLPPGQVIANVQRELQRYGYYRSAVDGLMGPNTRAALAAFQRDRGIEVTAAIDEATLATLGLA